MVYVGTGESTLRDSASYGNGVYRSTDGGRSWALINAHLPPIYAVRFV